MKRLFTMITICAMSSIALAQSPQMFDYQAVLRDASGNIMANQNVDVRIGIYDGGSLEYEETHSVNTDQYGLISLDVGTGTVTSGTFSSLNWSSTQYDIKVEVDNGSGYQSLGQQPLASVPYALNAGGGGGSPVWSTSGSDTYYNSGDVGIGNTSPSAALHLTLGGTGITDGFRMTSSTNSNQDWYFYLPSSDNLTLRDDGTDIVTFENGTGNVGIGTSTPSEKLQVAGSAEIDNNLHMTSSSSGDDTLYFGTAEYLTDGSDAFVIGSASVSADLIPATDDNGDLGSSSNRWDDVYATNGTIQTSDRRDKTSINNLDYGLEEVMNIRPVRFKWKEKENRGYKLGIIAQQVQKVLPEVVKTHDYKATEEGGPVKRVKNERLGVYYSDMIPVLIKAIQEQQQEIKELKKQKQELQSLKQEVQALKQQMKNSK